MFRNDPHSVTAEAGTAIDRSAQSPCTAAGACGNNGRRSVATGRPIDRSAQKCRKSLAAAVPLTGAVTGAVTVTMTMAKVTGAPSEDRRNLNHDAWKVPEAANIAIPTGRNTMSGSAESKAAIAIPAVSIAVIT